MKNLIVKASIVLLSLISASISVFSQLTPGSMAGTPAVAPSGAFTYSIPIALPPGINGVMPQLSLSYNSMAGNGLLGNGWSLAGLSSIIRTSSDIYHNSIVDPLNFNSDDVFMLDGNRLVPIGPSGTTVFETNVKSYSKITSFGFSGSGPDYFIVEGVNGLVYEYGNTPDSKLLIPAFSPVPNPNAGEIYSWLVNKIYDRKGNYVAFNYWHDPVSGDHRINQITYSGNQSVPLSTSMEINFYYGLRLDNYFTHVAGSRVSTDYRLEQIEIKHGSSVLHTYDLTYNDLTYNTDFYSHLTSVKETGESGNYLPTTDFTYGGPTPAVTSHVTTIAYDPGFCAHVADFNGDGMSDFFNVKIISSTSPIILPITLPPPEYKMYKNNHLDNFSFVTGASLPSIPIMQYFNYGEANFNTGRDNLLHLDYNGDGKEDLLTISYNVTDFYIYLSLANSTGTGLGPATTLLHRTDNSSLSEQAHITVGDFVGNGKMQILIFYPLTVAPPWDTRPYDTYLYGDGFSQTGSFISHVVHFNAIDYDGDGKSELYTTTAGSVSGPGWSNQIYSISTAFASPGVPVSGTGILTLNVVSSYTSYPNKEHRTYFGDFNGDGKTDVLTWTPFPGPGIWHLGYAKGNGGFDPVDLTALGYLNNNDPFTSNADDNYVIADFNGDGKDDILEIYDAASNKFFKVYYSKGNNQFDVETTMISPLISDISEGSFVAGDFNGDGQADVLKFGDMAHPHNSIIFYFHKNDQRQLLQQITKNDNEIPANGQKISVSYLPLTQDVDYQHCAMALTYPFHETINGRLKVVKTLDNNRTSLHEQYNYQGCVTHCTGLGFRGFEKIISNNPSTLRVGIQSNDQYSFETVVPLEVSTHWYTTYTLGVTPPYLTRKQFVYGEEILPNNIHIVYPKEETSEDFVNNLQTKTTYTYIGSPGSYTTLNNYGKPDKVTVDAGYGEEVTVQDFVYSTSDPFFYNQGKPKEITTTVTRSSSSAYTRKTSYLYNADGSVDNMKIDPSTSHENSISYTYDAFGNKLTETSSVALLPPITSTFVYTPDKRFPSQLINALGQSELSTYDAWGNVTSRTDINGLVTSYTYDDFNRITSTTTPTGVVHTTSYLWANSPSLTECPTGIFSLAIKNTTSGIVGNTTEFYDYSGRVWRTVNNSFNGLRLYRDAEYAVNGTLTRASLPYYSGGTPMYTNMLYDLLGRKTSESSPTKILTFAYSPVTSTPFTHLGMVTTVTNTSVAPARSKETTIDATGKTTYIVDAGGTGTIKYTYGSNGNVDQVSANGMTTDYTYDNWGNVASEDAPNKNLTTYTYDNRDRLKTKLDFNMVSFSYNYDILGRLTSKVGPDGPYNYVYDGAGVPTLGKLISVTGPAITPYIAPQTTNTYDAFSRLASQTEQINGSFLTSFYTYDAYDRTLGHGYPDGNNISYLYNSYGYLSDVGASGFGGAPYTPLWRKISENEFGQTTGTSYGFASGVTTSVSTPPSALPMLYNEINTFNTHGFQTGSLVYNGGGTIKDFSYTFDEPTGDLTYRKDLTRGFTEFFTYDNLDRLTSAYASGPGLTAINMFEYAANGNMTKKLDISPYDWKYNKYAVTEIANTASVIPSFTQTATYTPFDKIKRLVEDNKTIDFIYKADEQRGMTKYYTSGSLTQTCYYSENYEKTIDALGNTTQISYVMAEGKPVAMFVTNGTTTVIKSVITDYQGSITHILDDAGFLDEERSYDVWGRMRNPNTWGYTGIPTYAYDRGYTAQELLKDFNVINLNGRLYDPLIGRMFSVDPYISDPNNSQAYNSYSYALNNPLKYTDKDGNMPILAAALIGGVVNFGIQEAMGHNRTSEQALISFGIGAAAGAAGCVVGAAVAGSIGFGGAAGGATVGASAGFASGFVSGAGTSWANGASFGDGLVDGLKEGGIGAVTGGIFGGITGGINAVRNGENFWNGEATNTPTTSIKNMTESGSVYNADGETGVIYVVRKWETDLSTISTFNTNDGSMNGYILEPPGPSTTESMVNRRIPQGTYNVRNVGSSKKFPYEHYRIYNNDVPESRAILIHRGNLPAHTHGCLLPGTTMDVNYVGGSKGAVNGINSYIKSYNGNVKVIIYDPAK